MIFFTIVAAYLFADFGSGVVHWVEDHLLTKPSRFSFINTIRNENEAHHTHPASVLDFTYWETIEVTAKIVWPLVIGAFLLGAPTIIWLGLLFGSFGNLVHRFAHIPPKKAPKILKICQAVGLLQSFKKHHVHHFDERGRRIPKEQTTGHFCAFTDWLNPILDTVGFWRLLDRLVTTILRVS